MAKDVILYGSISNISISGFYCHFSLLKFKRGHKTIGWDSKLLNFIKLSQIEFSSMRLQLMPAMTKVVFQINLSRIHKGKFERSDTLYLNSYRVGRAWLLNYLTSPEKFCEKRSERNINLGVLLSSNFQW